MKASRFLIFVSVLFLMGCRSEEPFRHVVFADSPEMFNFVTPSGRTKAFITDGVSYNIVFDDEKRMATLTINNLRFSPEEEGRIVTFSNIEWTYVAGSHEKQRAIKAPSISSDNPGDDCTLTEVEIVYSESNELNDNPSAGFYASYTVNGIYSVLSYPYTVFAEGTTTVRSETEIMPQLVDYEPLYKLDLHPSSMTLDMTVKDLDISGKKVGFTLRGIAMTLTDDGYTLEENESVKLTLNGGETVLVKNVSGNAVLRDELNLVMELIHDGMTYYVEAYLSPDYNKLRQ